MFKETKLSEKDKCDHKPLAKLMEEREDPS